jgi:hypothetical protein
MILPRLLHGLQSDLTTCVVFRDYTDISIAVATPKGLVVPVLRNVDKMSFSDVEKVRPLCSCAALLLLHYHCCCATIATVKDAVSDTKSARRSLGHQAIW